VHPEGADLLERGRPSSDRQKEFLYYIEGGLGGEVYLGIESWKEKRP